MFRASSCQSSGKQYKADNAYGVHHWPCCSRLEEKRWFGVHLLWNQYQQVHIRATCLAHLILLDFNTRKILGGQYRSLSSSLYSFVHSLVTSSLLGPNILLNTLISNTLGLCSSLNVSDHVSRPYKTNGKIIVQYTSYSWNFGIFWMEYG
jgi:hypothetical protein